MADKTIDLTSSFELRGKWWLPDNENHKVLGTLIFDPTGEFILELDGLLNQSRPFGSTDFMKPPVIHGITNKGKHCSLLKTFEHNINISSGFSSSKITVNLAIIGVLIPTLDSFSCRSVSLQYTNLDAWMGQHAFSDNHHFKGKNKSHSVTYKMPKPIKYSIPEINSTLTFESSYLSSIARHSRTLKHIESIRLRPKRKMPLEWFMLNAHHLRNLLSLLSTEKFFCKNFKLELKRQKFNKLGYKTIKVEGELIFCQGFYQKVKPLYIQEIPFSHPIVRRDFNNILSIWFKDHKLLEPVHDLFFGSMYNQMLGVEFQFLSLTQALESLHRRFHKGIYISQHQYDDEYKKALVAAIPVDARSDLRSSLKSRIQYGNDYSLRKRLNLMGKHLNKSTCQLIADNFQTFVNKVVDTRNYLTHYDPSSKSQAMSVYEMIEEAFSLRLLLTIYLFKRIGIQESMIVDVIREHRKFKKPQISSLT